jgi:hypothetical protein
MVALSKPRLTDEREGAVYTAPVAAATKIWQGSLVALNASGNAVPGSVATTLKGFGRAEGTVDNTGGAAGDQTVDVKKGIFRFGNSAGGDLIARADIGNDCYIVDDQTVAKTSASSTRSIAGKIADVDSGGVWVRFT